MAISRETLRLIRNLRSAVGGFADDAVRDITRAWVAAWRTLEPLWVTVARDLVDWAQQHGRWPTPVEIARWVSVERAADATVDALDALTASTTTAVTAGAAASITATVAAEPVVIASQVPASAQAAFAAQAAAVILPSALDVIRTRVAQAIVAQTRPLSTDAYAAVRRELVRGVELGDNPQVAARRMVAAVNGAFEGGLSRANNIARTEVLDAYRTTSRYAHDAASDVLDGWVWLATITGRTADRTCPSCWAMHGTTHPLSEPGPLDHQSGRCARAPKVKPWPALGFDVPEPVDATPDARALFAALPRDRQVAILGARRLALLDSGLIGWDDIPARRDSDAWRPSYVPRPVRDLERLARRRQRTT